jgi:adenylate cyclase class 2
VSTETEVKVKIDDPAGFCSRLCALRARTVSSRHFEDNHLLDFRDKKLQSEQSLLRVRFAENQVVLTYKGPPRAEGVFKTREELETKLENGATMHQILERLGMHVCFRYQKYRQEFELEGVRVAVDETPIGNYAELEGSEQRILDLAHKIGLAETQFLRSSYYTLYQEYCRKKGITPEFMVF